MSGNCRGSRAGAKYRDQLSLLSDGRFPRRRTGRPTLHLCAPEGIQRDEEFRLRPLWEQPPAVPEGRGQAAREPKVATLAAAPQTADQQKQLVLRCYGLLA